MCSSVFPCLCFAHHLFTFALLLYVSTIQQKHLFISGRCTRRKINIFANVWEILNGKKEQTYIVEYRLSFICVGIFCFLLQADPDRNTNKNDKMSHNLAFFRLIFYMYVVKIQGRPLCESLSLLLDLHIFERKIFPFTTD